jgi:hypothetical protein
VGVRTAFPRYDVRSRDPLMASRLSRTPVVIWLGAVAGVLCVIPYAGFLAPGALPAAASRLGVPVYQVVLASVLQNALVLGLMTFTGLWAARRLGLGAPLLEAWLEGRPPPFDPRRSVLAAAGLGAACGLAIVALDGLLFAALTPHAAGQLQRATPPAWMGLLASVEGGITEEVELRLFLLSFLALGIRYLRNLVSGDRATGLSPAIFWTANIVAAVAFGLGHLPTTAQLVHLTPVIVLRAVALNGILGMVAGYLFWRRGIEMAMVCHFAADLVLHVATPLAARAAALGG